MGWASHQAKVSVRGESASASVGKAGFKLRLGYWVPLSDDAMLEIGIISESKDGILFHRNEPGGIVLGGHVGVMFF